MANKPFNPSRIVDLDKDYYAVLGLQRGCLPTGATRKDKQEVNEILARAYRESARRQHPDMPGGSEDGFRLVVQAQYILEDQNLRRYYESGGSYRPMMVGEGGTQFQVDWDALGTYRQGTKADTVGYGLFMTVCGRMEELGIIPAFHPSDETHNYEWDWAISEHGAKLSLSLVHDSSEVLRLTGGADVADAEAFKIYFCIPRASLHFLRGEKENFTVNGKTDAFAFGGKLAAATYSDFNLLETTNAAMARAYIAPGGNLERDLISLRDGSLAARQKAMDAESGQQKWLSTSDIKQYDTDILKSILRSRQLVTVTDERAADFLDNFPAAKK